MKGPTNWAITVIWLRHNRAGAEAARLAPFLDDWTGGMRSARMRHRHMRRRWRRAKRPRTPGAARTRTRRRREVSVGL